MTEKEYITTKKKLKQNITDIQNEANNKIVPIEEDIKMLEETYKQELLTQNPHIQIGKQFKYRADKVWIVDIKLDTWSNELKVTLNKVKKDGTNGNAIANGYGASITSLKEIV